MKAIAVVNAQKRCTEMVGGIGIEPMTPSMSPRCSAAELAALNLKSTYASNLTR